MSEREVMCVWCASCLGGCHDALTPSDMFTGKHIDRVSKYIGRNDTQIHRNTQSPGFSDKT